MTKFIKYQGYLRSSEGDWIHLGDELVFPSDGIPDIHLIIFKIY